MSDNPWLAVVLTLATWYVFRLWWQDLRAARAGTPNPKAFPGAVEWPPRLVIVGIAGSVVLVALETAGEYALGISAEQSTMVALFAVYSVLAAPFLEELVFRGYLVVDRSGPVARWGAAVAASLVFALAHQHLFNWGDSGFEWTLTAKGWFSTGALFASSMWFYALRLHPANAGRSLWPCIVAHAAKNAVVVAVKGATGYLAWV